MPAWQCPTVYWITWLTSAMSLWFVGEDRARRKKYNKLLQLAGCSMHAQTQPLWGAWLHLADCNCG